ncbi:MAG TPA: LysR substrate-binding domain-containing protein [Steroidobacteraceae bacterium]|jgi:LysR family glycine cleavage system transcriptional activator|nr:LysR substrate-binding domain-containing protein [Steroidobacteraceae bacterium]
MSKLPPLLAMRAFEAVGRTGSVREAAVELGVSSGAITQHVHALETHLETRLVQRNGRSIELTAQGKLYLPHLTKGFAELRTGHDQLELSKRSSHLCISTYPSLATKWLAPLMFAWKKQHPTASATISGVHPEPALEAGEADFRISYGNRNRFHSRFTHLFTDRLVVVASPALLARVGPLSHPRDLLKWPLLWVDWGDEYVAPPTWNDWFANAGVSIHDLQQDLVFSLPAAAVDAAIESQGFGLVQYSVVASALSLGTLVHVLPPELPLPEAHFLAWSGAALEKPLGLEFHSWIIKEAKRFDRRD